MAISSLLDSEVFYQNTNTSKQSYRGRPAVLSFYSDIVARIPDGMRFVLDDVYEQGEGRVCVTWHVELREVELPWSRSNGIYTFTSGAVGFKLLRIQDASELPMGLALPALAFAVPALSIASPFIPALKAAAEVPKTVSNGVSNLADLGNNIIHKIPFMQDANIPGTGKSNSHSSRNQASTPFPFGMGSPQPSSASASAARAVAAAESAAPSIRLKAADQELTAAYMQVAHLKARAATLEAQVERRKEKRVGVNLNLTTHDKPALRPVAI